MRRRKPVDSQAAMAEGVDYLLREFKGLPKKSGGGGGVSDGFGGPIEPTFLVAAVDARSEIRAVADFVCDGTADEEEIQAAIDLAAGMGGGRIVLAGNYFDISATIIAKASISVEGMGGYATNIWKNGSTAAFEMWSHSSLRDLWLDGEGRGIQTYVSHRGQSITDCWLDFVDEAIYIDRSDDVRIERNYIYSSAEAPIYVNIGDYISIVDNYLEGGPASGGQVHMVDGHSITITGNRFLWPNDRNILAAGVTSLIVTDNQIFHTGGSSEYAVDIQGDVANDGYQNIVTDNVIDSNGDAALIYFRYQKSFIVTGNTIYVRGVTSAICGVTVEDSHRGIINSNTLTPNGRITVDGSDGIVVSDNLITGPDDGVDSAAIVLTGTSARISVWNNHYDGAISGTAYDYGLTVGASVTDTLVADNRFDSATAEVKDSGTGTSTSLASPLTTKGDVWGYDTADNRLPVGTDTHVLTADSAEALGVKWAAPSTAAGGKATTLMLGGM